MEEEGRGESCTEREWKAWVAVMTNQTCTFCKLLLEVKAGAGLILTLLYHVLAVTVCDR